MLPPSPTRWFRLGAVLLGLAVLPAAEGILRLTGAVDHSAPALPEGTWAAGERQQPGLVEEGGRVRPTPAAADFMQPLDFAAQPAEGVRRVLVFGGSATLGVPVEATPERTFPGRLQARLAAVGFPAEVINLGGASFGTDQVRALLLDALAYQPDAVVIYAGNNEYFNYNLRLYEGNRRWHAERLEGLHLVAALRRLLGRERTVQTEQTGQDAVVAAATLDTLRQTDTWPAPEDGRRDPIHAAVVDRYRENLTAVAAATAEAGVPVLIARMPANLAEPPWLAAAPGNAEAAEAALAGDCEAAEEAIASTPGHAGGWYRRGMCSRAAGAPVSAWTADLQTALSLDLAPGRPSPDLQAVPAQIAADWDHVSAVSLDALFSAESSPPFGLTFFHDSCHLTPDGYDRLAGQIAVELVRRW